MTSWRAERIIRLAREPRRLESALALLEMEANRLNLEDSEAVQVALDRIGINDPAEKITYQTLSLAFQSNYPVFIANEHNQILLSNDFATELTNENPIPSLVDLNIDLAGKRDFSIAFEEFKNSDSDDCHLRASKICGEPVDALIAIKKHYEFGEKRPLYLLLVMTFVWTTELSDYLVEKFDLSRTQLAVLQGFVSGMTLGEIAEARGRSIATVRKQFYGVSEKLGAQSQVELTRQLITISNLIATIGPEMRPIFFQHREKARVLRPDGRKIDVTLGGDPSGMPVVVLSSIFSKFFGSKHIRQFVQEGIFGISMCMPGYGNTSTPTDEAKYMECLKDDLTAILDQLNIEKAVLVGTDFCFRFALELSKLMPDRISSIVAANIMLPLPYNSPRVSKFCFIDTAQRLVRKGAATRKVLFGIMTRTLFAIGPERSIRLVFKSEPSRLKAHLAQEKILAIKELFACLQARGVKMLQEDLEWGFQDCNELIKNCPVPIVLASYGNTTFHDLDYARQFVAKFPNVMRLSETELSDQLMNTPVFETLLNLNREQKTKREAKTFVAFK